MSAGGIIVTDQNVLKSLIRSIELAEKAVERFRSQKSSIAKQLGPGSPAQLWEEISAKLNGRLLERILDADTKLSNADRAKLIQRYFETRARALEAGNCGADAADERDRLSKHIRPYA